MVNLSQACENLYGNRQKRFYNFHMKYFFLCDNRETVQNFEVVFNTSQIIYIGIGS
jgi:hypothetical protein